MIEKKNIRIVVEANETEQMALDRAKKQLKLNDADLENYEIYFYPEIATKRTFKDMVGKAF